MAAFPVPRFLNNDLLVIGDDKRMNMKYLMKKITAAAAASVMIFGTVPCRSVRAEEAPEIDGLTFESEMPLEYAQKFKIYNYADDYRLLDINDGTQYLVVPEGKEAPENLDSDITVLQMPLDRVYLTATSVMSLYDSLDAIDQIRLSGTQANGWYSDDAVSAMEAGDILFAGKYNEPDYELLISEDCDLTIESTMIFHSPKVKEMIEDLGIPVLVEYATYEPHPLGRVEWIKLYGVLTGKEQEAEERFEEQK